MIGKSFYRDGADRFNRFKDELSTSSKMQIVFSVGLLFFFLCLIVPAVMYALCGSIVIFGTSMLVGVGTVMLITPVLKLRFRHNVSDNDKVFSISGVLFIGFAIAIVSFTAANRPQDLYDGESYIYAKVLNSTAPSVNVRE